MDIKKEYQRWLENATTDADVATELKTLDDAKIEDALAEKDPVLVERRKELARENDWRHRKRTSDR